MFVEEELGEMRLVEYRVESETKIEVAGSSLLLSATRALSLAVSGCRLEQLVDVGFDKTHTAVFVPISSCVVCVYLYLRTYVCMCICVYVCVPVCMHVHVCVAGAEYDGSSDVRWQLTPVLWSCKG